jgi:Calx-beta domain
MRELLDGLGLPSRTVLPSTRRRLRARRGVATSWPVAALGLVVLGIIAALTWNRLPADLRVDLGQRAAATGATLGQALQTARAWVTTEPAPSTVEAEQPATSVASPASTMASTPEAAAPVVARPMPEPVTPDVGATVADPALTGQSIEPLAAVAEPSKTELAVSPAQANDGPGALGFASDTYTVSESDSMARVNVRRRGGAAGSMSFAWRTADDSAVAGEDYASAEGRETMAAGQTTATLLIPIVADSVAERTELLDVVIEDASGADLDSLTRVPVIIVDDD